MSSGLPTEGASEGQKPLEQKQPIRTPKETPLSTLSRIAKRLLPKRFGKQVEQAVNSGKSGIEELAEKPVESTEHPEDKDQQTSEQMLRPEEISEKQREGPRYIGTRDPVSYYIEDPRGVHQSEEVMQQAEQILQLKREYSTGLTEATLAPELQEKMEQSFNVIRTTFIRQVQEMGIDYKRHLPDFSSVHFLHVTPDADEFTQRAGAFYDANTGNINIVVRPNDTPLTLAIRLAHEFRHAVSSHDVLLEYSYFDSQTPPFVIRKEGLMFLTVTSFDPSVGGGQKSELQGKFMDNALAIDFEGRTYQDLAKMFPEDAAKRKDALQRNDNVAQNLARLLSYSGISWNELQNLAEPHMEINPEGEFYINQSILLNLLVARALYERIKQKAAEKGEVIDPKKMFEEESLNSITGFAGVSQLITDAVGWNLGAIIREMTDAEYSGTLGDILTIIESKMEDQVQ